MLTTPIQDREIQTLLSLVAQLTEARLGGLTGITTLQALLYISQQPDGTTATAMTEVLSISTAGVTNTLDSLEKLHFVERTRNPLDRREWTVRITDRGRKFASKILAS